MKILERRSTVTVEFTEQEARDLAYTIPEALFGLSEPVWGGYPFNWRSDPQRLKDLYNIIRPADWRPL